MNESLFDAWTVETADLTARVAAAVGVAPPVERELLAELRAVRRELAELRAATAILGDEVARLRLAPPPPPHRALSAPPREGCGSRKPRFLSR